MFRNLPLVRERTCECGVLLNCPTCYMLTEHSHCSIRNMCCVMTVVGSRWLPANVLPIWFVVAEHGPSEKSETDALPKINCHTLSQQQTDLLVGPIGVQWCIVNTTQMCKSTNVWWPNTAREEHPKQMPPHTSDANTSANVVKLMMSGHEIVTTSHCMTLTNTCVQLNSYCLCFTSNNIDVLVWVGTHHRFSYIFFVISWCGAI